MQSAHADLGGRVATGFNTVTNTTDTSDTAGHGTHVAGIIAASANNGAGVAGIAPDATIRPIKVFTGATAYESDIAEGFTYAGQQGIPIVNASLGGNGTSATIESAMATYPTTLFVVAAGNNGTNNDVQPVTPCVTSLANVLCVGASTMDDTKASFSNYGASTVDLFAPGESIASTYPSPAYKYLDGTSMASPYVAGTAALVASITPLRGAALANQIKATVDHPAALIGLGVTGGRLNAARAVGAATDAPTQPVIRAQPRQARQRHAHDVDPRGRHRELPRLRRVDRRLHHGRDLAHDHDRRPRGRHAPLRRRGPQHLRSELADVGRRERRRRSSRRPPRPRRSAPAPRRSRRRRSPSPRSPTSGSSAATAGGR